MVATVEPGKHKLSLSAENTDPIQIEVGAGRTYIILTTVRMGFGKARLTAKPTPHGRSKATSGEPSTHWAWRTAAPLRKPARSEYPIYSGRFFVHQRW